MNLSFQLGSTLKSFLFLNAITHLRSFSITDANTA